MLSLRYNSLHEPVHIRRENLEDAMLLQQLLRDIEDEMLWVAEKEPLAASQDLGASLTAVQNLQKKHQVCTSIGMLLGTLGFFLLVNTSKYKSYVNNSRH